MWLTPNGESSIKMNKCIAINRAATFFLFLKNSKLYSILTIIRLFLDLKSTFIWRMLKNCLYFYILDCTIINSLNLNLYYIGYQSLFFDYQILIESKFDNLTYSLSNIYSGASWVERELKETNNVFFFNLNDSRKLLLNYNYSNSIQYNNFNNIINDLLI